MNCPDCNAPPFPSEAILQRHREFEHPEEYAADREAAAKAAAEKKAAAGEPDPDDRFTKDGFLRRTGRRTERPSLFPSFDLAAPASPWDEEPDGTDLWPAGIPNYLP
jgi:hypothetical protein